MQVFYFFLYRFALVITLSCVLPSSAWANFFNYARYLQLDVVPEVQIIRDAYKNTRNPTQSSIRALIKLLVISKRSVAVDNRRSQVEMQASLYLSSLYFSEGRIANAESLLSDVQKLLKNIDDKKLQLYFYYQSGMVSLSRQRYDKALLFYQSARNLSLRLKNLLMLALNQQAIGEVQLFSGERLAALKNFKSAYVGLRNLDHVVLAADAGILYFALLSKQHNIDFSKFKISELIDLVHLTPDEAKRTQQMSELLDTYNSLDAKSVPTDVHQAFRQVADDSLRLANRIDKGQISVTNNLAKIYENDGEYSSALKLVQEALHANKKNLKDSEMIPLYLQRAKLLSLTNNSSESIAAYQTALTKLQKTMFAQDTKGKNNFLEDIIQTYDSLIGLLFEKQRSLLDDATKQANLRQLRDYIEEKNYFYFGGLLNQNHKSFSGSKNAVTVLSKKAAVIYPVLLPDRLEVLVSLPRSMKIFTKQISNKKVQRTIAELRKSIEQPNKNNDYKKNAMALYRWLITPLKHDLLKQNISALVFVLDKSLAKLPTSVLIDEKSRRYLVEQYAIAVSSGLMLTDISTRRRKRGGVLYLGLTSGKYNTPKSVHQEIKSIAATTRVSAHLDDSFNAGTLSKIPAGNEYNKIHISAPYSIETVFNRSYVMSYAGKLSLQSMFGVLTQKRVLELIVLDGNIAESPSAASDGGILAVAHSLGSRSVVASLWPIKSDATPLFMSEFYTILSSSSMSVSTAIRRAKIRLIVSRKYQHPAYWARFELFGSWL